MFLEYYKLNDQPFGVTPGPGLLVSEPNIPGGAGLARTTWFQTITI
jgi:hypothetical protein